MLRTIVAALALAASATSAFALERNDLIGEWQAEWANAPGQAPDGGGAMRLTADTSEDGLDGVTPAPGLDGVMNGEVNRAANGALIWSGRWASVWPEGATTGTFRFVFTNADTFTGTWSTDDGEITSAAWNGRRAH